MKPRYLITFALLATPACGPCFQPIESELNLAVGAEAELGFRYSGAVLGSSCARGGRFGGLCLPAPDTAAYDFQIVNAEVDDSTVAEVTISDDRHSVRVLGLSEGEGSLYVEANGVDGKMETARTALSVAAAESFWVDFGCVIDSPGETTLLLADTTYSYVDVAVYGNGDRLIPADDLAVDWGALSPVDGVADQVLTPSGPQLTEISSPDLPGASQEVRIFVESETDGVSGRFYKDAEPRRLLDGELSVNDSLGALKLRVAALVDGRTSCWPDFDHVRKLVTIASASDRSCCFSGFPASGICSRVSEELIDSSEIEVAAIREGVCEIRIEVPERGWSDSVTLEIVD